MSQSLSSERRRRLIAAAVRAPSGDNCQPWSFHFEDDRLNIRILPQRAASFFDYRHAGTYVSVGAVIENIRVQAYCDGMNINVAYGEKSTENIAATVTFSGSANTNETAAQSQAMFERTVNRRPFFPWPISRSALRSLLAEPVKGPDVRVIERRSDMARWARLIYLADRIRFSHPVIHEELFSKILFDKETAQRVRVGLEIDRLGLGPTAAPMLRFLRPWERMRRFSSWGLNRLLAEQSRLLALSSGALIVVAIPSDGAAEWIRAGEQVQRLWVRAQNLGLCVHPMTVALYLDLRYRHEGMKNFLPEHHTWLHSMRTLLAQVLPTGIGAMLFRIGYGWKMKTQAIRLPVETLVED